MRLTVLMFLLVVSVPLSIAADDLETARLMMVDVQIAARGVRDERVLQAMRAVKRHEFVPPGLAADAYGDYALPIGDGQTISQPYIVALMTESLGLKGGEKVLEIGTGSGYQAAVLSRLVRKVFTVEIKPKLHEAAAAALKAAGASKVRTRLGDGYFGWPEEAPFDCIMITAAVDHVPPPLMEQLSAGGRMVLPLGSPFRVQSLVLVTKAKGAPTVKLISKAFFVPLTGGGGTGVP